MDFHLGFQICLISGLLILKTMSATHEADIPVPCCPPDWTLLGSRCFLYQNRAVPFGEAESICLSLGGNLASIHSSEEFLFVKELIHKESGSYTRSWIGAHDGVKEGLWMWTDGSRFDHHFWGSGEPNNHGGENCVETNWLGDRWNDIPCRLSRAFVCAKDL